jgi:Calcineurin-like phosphoesterase
MIISKNYSPFAAILIAALLISACSHSSTRVSTNTPEAVFTVQAEGQRAMVRVVTRAAACPDIAWDGQAPQRMHQRAVPATPRLRQDSGQNDSKAAVFDVLACEATWVHNAAYADVAGHQLSAPSSEIRRIVIVADTGCRLKASENAFQDCNDPAKWPFAQIAQSAAALKPDLVIHIGDMHYRESSCPAGNAGCVNAEWGYGFDAWKADFFKPARPLLAAAPWVFVRGNHESCFRAGQGWFRFFDTQAWNEARSCNDAINDTDADYTEPYAVPIASDAQLVVFDSSKTSGKPFSQADHAYGKYLTQLKKVEALTLLKKNSFFLSHHPLLAFAPVARAEQIKSGGNAGLVSVFDTLYPQRFFPTGVSMAMHGHVHLFQAISFQSDHPTSLVMGNSGSANEGFAPNDVPVGSGAIKNAVIADYASRSDYGFATLDRVGFGAKSDWLLTEYTTTGMAVIQCKLSDGKSLCVKV